MYVKILNTIKSIADEEELEISLELVHMETLAEAIAEMMEQEFAERLNVILERIEEVFDE